MSTSTAGSISFQGIGSGTDFGAMIDELRKYEEYQINSLEAWKVDWEMRVAAFDELTNLMGELEVATSELSNIYDIIDLVGSSSNEYAVTADASSDAIPGTYTIDVQQLASAAIVSTKTQNAFVKDEEGNFSPLQEHYTGNGTFSYTYGTGEDAVTVDIDVDGTMAIDDLVERINNDAQNPGVKASLVATGSGYVFQLQSAETGSENALTVSATNMSFSDPASWNTLEAKDAKFVLNGFTDQVLTSSSNSVKEVIDGVTINLKNVTSSPTTISVTEDASKVQEKVEQWVDVVNQLRGLLADLTEVDADAVAKDPMESESQDDADIGSILTGNYAVMLLESRLNNIVTSPAFGFESTADEEGNQITYSLMSELGISTNVEEGSANYGLLEIDTVKLQEIIEANPMAVAELLAGSSGEAESENFIFANATDSVKPGKYDVSYSTDDTGNIINDSVYINGVLAAASEETPGRYTVADANNAAYGLAIQFTAGAIEPNQTFTEDTVSVKKGKAIELNEFFAAEIRDVPDQPGNGAIPIVRSNYMEVIANIELEISKEEDRLDLWEERQRIRYASLDAYLGVQTALMESNAQALAQATIGQQV